MVIVNPQEDSNVQDDEYRQIEVPVEHHHIDKNKMHPDKLRRFITHLAKASDNVEVRAEAKKSVKDGLERIKSLALNKRTKKTDIESEITEFEDLFSKVIMDEKAILESQIKGTREITLLKQQINILSSKLAKLRDNHSDALNEKAEQILDLKESMAQANIKLSESGIDRQKKIEEIEKKIKGKSPVTELEAHLKSLEQRHNNLKKSGKYNKRDIDRLKKIIDTHKTKISKLKN